MKGWKASSNRKVHQRALNSEVRKMNENIEKDSLWRGRFYVRQGKSYMYKFEDGSGYDLYVQLWFYDRKTGRTYCDCNSANRWCFMGGLKIWEAMNYFIVSQCQVWQKENPREDIYDWIADKEKRNYFKYN